MEVGDKDGGPDQGPGGGRLFGRYGPQYKDGGGGGSGGPRALILVVERKESGQNFPRFYLNKNVIIVSFFHRAESELTTISEKKLMIRTFKFP